MQGLARRETKRILSHVPVVLSGVFAWHCRFLPFVTCKPVLVLWLCQSAVATVQCSFLSLCCHIVIRCAATDCENKQGLKEMEKKQKKTKKNQKNLFFSLFFSFFLFLSLFISFCFVPRV